MYGRGNRDVPRVRKVESKTRNIAAFWFLTWRIRLIPGISFRSRSEMGGLPT